MYICLNLAGLALRIMKRFTGYPVCPSILIIDRLLPGKVPTESGEILEFLGIDTEEWRSSRKDIILPWGTLWASPIMDLCHHYGLGQGLRIFPVVSGLIYGYEGGTPIDGSVGHFSDISTSAARSPITETILDFVGISSKAEEDASIIIGGSNRQVFRISLPNIDTISVGQALEGLPINRLQWNSGRFGVILPWDSNQAEPIMEGVLAKIGRLNWQLLHCYAFINSCLVWFIPIMAADLDRLDC